MGKFHARYDIMQSNGKYISGDGKEKTRYHKAGILFQDAETERMFGVIDSPIHTVGKEGKVVITFNLFDLNRDRGDTRKPDLEQGAPGPAKGKDDDELPF